MKEDFEMDGMALFGDPFSRSQTYGQPASRNRVPKPNPTVTPPKTQPPTSQPAQQPVLPAKPVQKTEKSITSENASNTLAPGQKPETIAPALSKEPVQPEPQKKEQVMDLSVSEPDNPSPVVEDTARRKAHEADEAKRKAEWEAKQRTKKQEEEAVLGQLQGMTEEEAIAASIKRVSTEVERLTRRNMKELVAEHIQDRSKKDVAFARRTLHPHKNMVNCFQYINRMAKQYLQKEMEENAVQPTNGVYGGDVPDDLCYQWAEDYFNLTGLPEDKKEETFTPKPYAGTSVAKEKPKKTPPVVKKENKEKQETKAGYEQISFV